MAAPRILTLPNTPAAAPARARVAAKRTAHLCQGARAIVWVRVLRSACVRRPGRGTGEPLTGSENDPTSAATATDAARSSPPSLHGCPPIPPAQMKVALGACFLLCSNVSPRGTFSSRHLSTGPFSSPGRDGHPDTASLSSHHSAGPQRFRQKVPLQQKPGVSGANYGRRHRGRRRSRKLARRAPSPTTSLSLKQRALGGACGGAGSVLLASSPYHALL